MPTPQTRFYTSEDYWNLPEGERAELIDGKLYAMAPPGYRHQFLVAQFTKAIGNFIDSHKGTCRVIPAPFAVNLFADDQKWVEPDISVICDPDKITDQGYEGAPDWVIEVVSPESRKRNYGKKNDLYSEAGVREYWIVDLQKERTTIYRYEEDAAPVIVPFSQSLAVGIYKGKLSLCIADMLKNL